MTKEPKDKNKYVKQQTLLITALVALVVGFLGGLVVSDYKSGPEAPVKFRDPLLKSATKLWPLRSRLR
jgi:hypothetical protein